MYIHISIYIKFIYKYTYIYIYINTSCNKLYESMFVHTRFPYYWSLSTSLHSFRSSSYITIPSRSHALSDVHAWNICPRTYMHRQPAQYFSPTQPIILFRTIQTDWERETHTLFKHMRASFFLCSQSRPIDEPSVPSKEPYIHSKEPYTHPQKSLRSLVHTEVQFTIRPIAAHTHIHIHIHTHQPTHPPPHMTHAEM